MATVRLKKHVGIMNSTLGSIEVEHDQYMVEGLHEDTEQWILLGYIGKAANAPLNLIVHCPTDAVREEIRQAVELEKQKLNPSDSVTKLADVPAINNEDFPVEEEDEN